MVAFDTHN